MSVPAMTYTRTTMYSMTSPMTRYICHSPFTILNFDNEPVVDDVGVDMGEPEYADRTE
jgi:hypothetical protein